MWKNGGKKEVRESKRIRGKSGSDKCKRMRDHEPATCDQCANEVDVIHLNSHVTCRPK